MDVSSVHAIFTHIIRLVIYLVAQSSERRICNGVSVDINDIIVYNHRNYVVFRQAGKAPYITPTRLMAFINAEQRDPSANEILHPHCDEENAIKIISKYEKCGEMVKQGELTAKYCICWNTLCLVAKNCIFA